MTILSHTDRIRERIRCLGISYREDRLLRLNEDLEIWTNRPNPTYVVSSGLFLIPLILCCLQRGFLFSLALLLLRPLDDTRQFASPFFLIPRARLDLYINRVFNIAPLLNSQRSRNYLWQRLKFIFSSVVFIANSITIDHIGTSYRHYANSANNAKYPLDALWARFSNFALM